MSDNSNQMSLQDWALLVLLSLIWGGSFLFAEIAVREIPPLTLVLLRVAFAAITLNLAVALFLRGKNRDRLPWAQFVGMGLLNNVIPFTLIFYGQTEIGAGLAAIVNAMTPIWTLLIAHWSTSDERMSPLKIIGVLLGFSGVAVLIGMSAIEGISGAVWGQIAVLGATISYGFASVFGRRFKSVRPVDTARGQLTMSTLMMLPIAAFFDRFWILPMPGAAAIWSVILLAVLCTAFAYILFFRILARAGALNIALVTFLVPLSAVALGIIVLGETLATRHIAGMALIMLALVVIDGRLFRRIR